VAVGGVDDVVAYSEVATRLNLEQAGERASELVRIATRIPDARLVATVSDAGGLAAVVDAIGSGATGVLTSLCAPDLRRATLRLPAALTRAHSQLSLDAAREWVRSCFDLLIEVARLKDGRIRVLRVAEFSGVGPDGLELADIFRFVVERVATGGAIEGSFVSSERPRVAEQLEAAGVELDSSLFDRFQSR